ncbi:MAG: L-threonine 3-dehydrogenase, partial [Rhodobacteraceae bacterium]|nr:L-threonine 3-dehydrogenase [Paracoccaceae bacterium]
TIPVPMVVGHEYVGEVVEIGSHVRRLKVGERVTGEGHLVSMRSRKSRAGRFHLDPETRGVGVNVPGAFAEYLRLPAFNAIRLPDEIDDELGAVMDPLGNAVHTALSFDLIGEDVLITGAGPIGIMAAAIARHVGARNVVITDVNSYRLALAGHISDVVAVDVGKEDLPSVMSRLGMKEGFDVGFEMSGASSAFDQMVDHMMMGGNIAMLGLPSGPTNVDWGKIIFKSLTIKAIYGREMFETWYKMIAMLQSGLDIRPVITH